MTTAAQTAVPHDEGLYRYKECDGTDVETCLPAYFRLNGDLSFVSADVEAESLSFYCNGCEATVTVVLPEGEERSGRWGT